MAQKRQQAWSYIAGKKGVNRVRAYEDGKGGPLLLEWQETMFDNTGAVTGKKRRRESLTAAGVTTFAAAIARAKEKAEEVARGPAVAEPEPEGPLTLGRLLSLYLAEVLPSKRAGTQRLNRITARVVLAFFGPDAVVERIGPSGRPQTEIGRVRYNAFVKARAEGSIPGFPGRARPQTVRLTVVFMRAVFNWAKLERDDGRVLLLRNPWEGFPIPSEDVPTRPEMTKDLHATLVEKAPNWRMAVTLELCRETRRRMNSVRQIAISDLDLATGTVRWQGEFDKVGKTRVTPLSTRARHAIMRALEERRAEGLEGSRWLLPAPAEAEQPVSNNRLHNWMKATRRKHGITVPRLGYHAEKRAGIRDARFRALPPKVQEELAGTTWETMRRVYDYVDLPTLQDAVALLEAEPEPRQKARGTAENLPLAA